MANRANNDHTQLQIHQPPQKKNWREFYGSVVQTTNHDPSVDCKINLVGCDQCFSVEWNGIEGEISEHDAQNVDIDHETIFDIHLSNKYRCVIM